MASESQIERSDIVTLYHKYINGTVEHAHVPSKKWLDTLEDQIILFLGKLFYVKGYEKPLKHLAKPMQACHTHPAVKEHDIVLYNIAALINQLGGSMHCGALPLLANLICIAKKDFSSVNIADVQKLVVKFRAMITSPVYVSCELPAKRLSKLIDIVDGIRKYSEYLLIVAGGYNKKTGHSAREILQDLYKARNYLGA